MKCYDCFNFITTLVTRDNIVSKPHLAEKKIVMNILAKAPEGRVYYCRFGIFERIYICSEKRMKNFELKEECQAFKGEDIV